MSTSATAYTTSTATDSQRPGERGGQGKRETTTTSISSSQQSHPHHGNITTTTITTTISSYHPQLAGISEHLTASQHSTSTEEQAKAYPVNTAEGMKKAKKEKTKKAVHSRKRWLEDTSSDDEED
jgi:hypothetical protein